MLAKKHFTPPRLRYIGLSAKIIESRIRELI